MKISGLELSIEKFKATLRGSEILPWIFHEVANGSKSHFPKKNERDPSYFI